MKNQSISENLIYQRKLKGYSQEDLAEKTSVDVRTIQRIEKGEVQPHLQTVKLLAVGIDINVDNLIVLENPKEETIQRKWMLLLHALPFFGFIKQKTIKSMINMVEPLLTITLPFLYCLCFPY